MSIQAVLVKRAENIELPLQGLRAINELRAELDELQQAHIAMAREKGASWAEIAEALGISRQALQQKMRAASSRALRTDAVIRLEASPDETSRSVNTPDEDAN